MNMKSTKNVLSGPLHGKMKPNGSSHMEQREKKMKDAYKNAKPKSKGMMGGLNNQAVLQYSQNNFIQNKPQFSTFYGQGNLVQGNSHAVNQMHVQGALIAGAGGQYEYAIDGSQKSQNTQNQSSAAN